MPEPSLSQPLLPSDRSPSAEENNHDHHRVVEVGTPHDSSDLINSSNKAANGWNGMLMAMHTMGNSEEEVEVEKEGDTVRSSQPKR